MLEIVLIGINHKTSSVELREKLSFTYEEIENGLKKLLEKKDIKEALIFSTCNRTEILFVVFPDRKNKDIVKKFLGEYKKISIYKFQDALYTYNGDDAVRHIFRVASSLDSMIIGEPQILGQIKDAYKIAVANNSSKVILNRLLHKSFSIAKKVRRETGIGDNAVSISYAALELANKIFNDLSTKNVMLLGAGEMAELALEHLISCNVKKTIIANRTFENAVKLAKKFNGQAVKFEERENMLLDVDIIISSTGATDYVLTAHQVKKAMSSRKNKSIFFIDIAVPRNIDPAINQISNSYLYDIDDLHNIVDNNMEERKKKAIQGERLVEEAVIKFRQWMANLKLVPTIVAIKKKIELITQIETEKTLANMQNISQKDINAIKRMTQAIGKKIMHDPILFLKNTGEHRDDYKYLNFARHFFNIDDTQLKISKGHNKNG
ncbi:MAG: glutamyl-tRNA reductase [Desulfobacteraceae bacterium 4572_130]|nr:MAG: glutamyl-tRNA reductase [Desulfobacteraceae bacterium 4572_130]